MRRQVRSKDIRSESLTPRVHRRRSITRPAVDVDAVGAPQLAPGTVQSSHMGKQTVQEPNVDPPMVPRETFGWEQLPSRSAVVAERSNDYSIRRGGDAVRIVVRLSTALTTAGELVFYKNDVRFDVLMVNSTRPGPWLLTLPTGQREITEVFDIVLRPGDYVSHEITDAGTGGEGINVHWQVG